MCQDFYPAGVTTGEERELYNLPVIRRYKAGGLCSDRDYYSQLALSRRLGDRLADSTVGDKKREENKTRRRQVRNSAERSITSRKSMAPPSFRLPQPNRIGLIRPI